MILYMMVAAVTIVLACQISTTAYSDIYLSRRRVLNGVLMAAIFCILTALAALRIEVGNDYGTYVVTCHEIFQRGYVVTEPGFNFIVRILYTISGKEDHILMFAVFAAAINAVFLKAMKAQSDNFAISFFLFMTLGIYFRSFNTVRYYFALAIALYSLKYVINIFSVNGEAGISASDGSFKAVDVKREAFNRQELVKFLVLILFAATFHKSVLTVIPMYLLSRLPWNKWIIIGISIIGVTGLIFADRLLNVLLTLYPSYRNTVYLEENRALLDNAPVIGRCILVLIMCMLCYSDAIRDNVANRTYFNMNIMAIILYLTCWWMPLVTRFGYYLITSHILLVPGVIMSIRDEKKKKLLTTALILTGIIFFIYFLLTAANDGVRVLPYKSFLFNDGIWLNQTDLF